MHVRLLHESHGQRTFAVVLESGEDAPACLKAWAQEHDIGAATFTGIGAFREAVVGYFDTERREYLRIPVTDQVEVLTLAGNVTRDGDGPALHAHVVLGLRDGTARGGHLLEARVRPTLEVVAIETPSYLRRRRDSATGLMLLARD
jgi:predicted DNA-binding protein with PD1-like motif